MKIGFCSHRCGGLQIAERRRHWVEAVVSDGDGLCVPELREGLLVEAEIGLRVLAFRCRDVGSVRDGFSGQQADPGIVVALRDVVADLQPVFSSTELACGAIGPHPVRPAFVAGNR